jgi:acetyl-CoA carboxylase, biotin carboxylase subunit
MNTRIQVEHPVTELVTGIDLVQWQIRSRPASALVRAGRRPLQGHAIECRITSEDPANGFLPSTGRIQQLSAHGPGRALGRRHRAGYEVGLFYDPMLAKLIVHAKTREEAIDRMKRALLELRVVGVETSVPFHLRVMDEPDFRAGRLDIRYLEKHEARFSARAGRGDPARGRARRRAAGGGGADAPRGRPRTARRRPAGAAGLAVAGRLAEGR